MYKIDVILTYKINLLGSEEFNFRRHSIFNSGRKSGKREKKCVKCGNIGSRANEKVCKHDVRLEIFGASNDCIMVHVIRNCLTSNATFLGDGDSPKSSAMILKRMEHLLLWSSFLYGVWDIHAV